MRKQPPPPPAKCIAIDVDETLITRLGKLDEPLAEWVRKKHDEGYETILWSARGRKHAQAAADRHGIADYFDSILSKPGYIVDDLGWSWIKYTQVVRRLD